VAASIVGGVDLDAVRTIVALADAGRFQDAAREFAVRNPTPVYPHSLVHHRDNRHPGRV
jgi:hypothetical protein